MIVGVIVVLEALFAAARQSLYLEQVVTEFVYKLMSLSLVCYIRPVVCVKAR